MQRPNENASGESTDGDCESDGNDEADVSRWNSTDATTYLYSLKVRHNISHTAFAAMWDGFRKVLPVLQYCSHLPSARTLQRTVLKEVPEMKVDVSYLNKETKESEKLFGLEQVPKKKYADRQVYQPVYEVWRAKLEDVVKFHHSTHCHEEKVIILNIDGVPIGRTGRSQTVVSVKFLSCRNIYHLTNAIPFTGDSKKDLSVTFLVGDILQSIKDLNLDLKYICADAPMRSLLRNQKAHTARRGCDYCYGHAGHKGRPIWGLDTMDSEKRTFSRLREDYLSIAAKKNKFSDYGYRGRSEILDILPDFDIIERIPADPMHLLYLGISRALIELMFSVGETRPTNLVDRPQSIRDFDEGVVHVKVPSELPRRPRPMDFKNWKGSEWRHLALIYFPILAEALRPGIRCQIWLEFCFLCRSYSIPQEYFDELDKDYLESVARSWYLSYYNAFGELNMRYNIHLLLHLLRVRIHGAFPDISAFTFEGSFAVGGRAQHVGTASLGLQFMRQSYLRPLNGHTCQKKIKTSVRTTSTRQDNLLYSEKSCYELAEEPKPHDHFLKVRKINVTAYVPPAANHLDFTSVGVFKFISVATDLQYLKRDHVLGKLVRVPTADADILVSLSNSQLREAE